MSDQLGSRNKDTEIKSAHQNTTAQQKKVVKVIGGQPRPDGETDVKIVSQNQQ